MMLIVQSSEIEATSVSLQVPVVSSAFPSSVKSTPAIARSLSGSTGAAGVLAVVASDWALSPLAFRARTA